VPTLQRTWSCSISPKTGIGNAIKNEIIKELPTLLPTKKIKAEKQERQIPRIIEDAKKKFDIEFVSADYSLEPKDDDEESYWTLDQIKTGEQFYRIKSMDDDEIKTLTKKI
jgi:hypothetical protein